MYFVLRKLQKETQNSIRQQQKSNQPRSAAVCSTVQSVIYTYVGATGQMRMKWIMLLFWTAS